jgi:anti-sigma factor RsiW
MRFSVNAASESRSDCVAGLTELARNAARARKTYVRGVASSHHRYAAGVGVMIERPAIEEKGWKIWDAAKVFGVLGV